MHSLDLVRTQYSEEELEDNVHFFVKNDWWFICFCQDLSENFIEKHADKVNWIYISEKQSLSEGFIKRHIEKINIEILMYNDRISEEIKKEIKTLKEII
jgi:hypothetical protein